MNIYFGLALDESFYPLPAKSSAGWKFLGPNTLLHTLESHLGLAGHLNDVEYLRIEQYRQALHRHLLQATGAFFRTAFEADQFAVATELLGRRDELLSGGWSFTPEEDAPERLKTLAEVEKILKGLHEADQPPIVLSPGFADRMEAVIAALADHRQPIRQATLAEPMALLPQPWPRVFRALEQTGVTIRQAPEPLPGDDASDLSVFQAYLSGNRLPDTALKADGSVVLLQAARETSLAQYLAALFRLNPGLKPLCLVPDKQSTLDDALVQEGMPSLGLSSASPVRPTLQVLKLAPVFLWEPVDPFKVMEFVSLSIKPLEEELPRRIASFIAQTPGLHSEGWHIMINRYFDELKDRPRKNPQEIKKQYDFWFNRPRYDMAQSAPREDCRRIFSYLSEWAVRQFEDGGGINKSLRILAEQARRVAELLAALPEERLTALELERIVRTIYEPPPVQLREAECGHLPFVRHPGAICDRADALLWWNFSQQEPDYFFSKWYRAEREYLERTGVRIQNPAEENALLVLQRKKPVQQARHRLILTVPEWVEGQEVNPHPLMGDLSAAFGNLEAITVNIDAGRGEDWLNQFFTPPGRVSVPHRPLGSPPPFVRIAPGRLTAEREAETLTSLESLFYYPYQWVFRYQIKLRKSPILSVVKDNTLFGNLAHRFFQRLLDEWTGNWEKHEIEQWIDRQAPRIFQREGAVLLLYGREPERAAFIQRLKFAAWSLVNLIQRNGWKEAATEKPLEGLFKGRPVNGRADLVLEREGELAVIDLKWRGASRREQMIRNEEDLQLVLYANLLSENGQGAHTAYFIMENGQMIARNELAFKGISPVSPQVDHLLVNQRIWQRMESTYEWRLGQIRQGAIEIRCTQTRPALEDIYAGELMELLELPGEDARYDDYRTLIYLVD
ncbi:MAG TPA: PD-(D/E)XK nuclease family protein [Flavilitoribacter sp.]|nr:PD-(D/E)XK nuclease family protein [Flavilitoribacter sp.]